VRRKSQPADPRGSPLLYCCRIFEIVSSGSWRLLGSRTRPC
jgi:hypothetical protein